MVKELNYNLELNEFKLQSHYYVQSDTIGKSMNALILSCLNF